MVATRQLDIPAYWLLLTNPMFTPERPLFNEQIGGANHHFTPLN
jgi:hypothetical protein